MSTNRFEKEALTWDESPQRKAMASSIAKALMGSINLQSEQRVLDYGAGTGLIALEIAKKVRHVVAMDSALGMLNVIKNKIEQGPIANVSTALADLESATLSDTFDVIFGSFVNNLIKSGNK